jgi:hypothetical protein
MLGVIMLIIMVLDVFMLSAVMLNVLMPNDVGPIRKRKRDKTTIAFTYLLIYKTHYLTLSIGTNSCKLDRFSVLFFFFSATAIETRRNNSQKIQQQLIYAGGILTVSMLKVGTKRYSTIVFSYHCNQICLICQSNLKLFNNLIKCTEIYFYTLIMNPSVFFVTVTSSR